MPENEMVAEIPIAFVARALAAMRLHEIPGPRYSQRKETYVFLPEWRRTGRSNPRRHGVPTLPTRWWRLSRGIIYTPRNLARPRAWARTTFFSTPEILRARAAASSFSTFLIIIYNWTRARRKLPAIDN